MKTGINYQVSDKVSMMVECELNYFQKPKYIIGIEYKPVKSIAIRMGTNGTPILNSLGIGYYNKNVQFDLSAS